MQKSLAVLGAAATFDCNRLDDQGLFRGIEAIALAVDGFELGAYRADPAGKPKGGVVIIQEIFGVNKHIKEVCDGYAKDGYVAIAPALFYRVERDLELGYVPEDQEKGKATRGQLDWDNSLNDSQAAAEAIRGDAGKVGIIGYCLGGSVAWIAATRGNFDASVS